MYQPLRCSNQNGRTSQKMMITDNRKKRNNRSSMSDEDKEDAMKRAMLEQRHLENYRNLYRLRNAMYVQYRDLLNKKVQKQRVQIQMSDLNFKQNLEQRGRKKIIGLQNELTRHGILKNQQDYEDFWTLTLEGTHGSRLKEKLQDIKSKMAAAKSFPSRPLVRISAAQSDSTLLTNRCGQQKTSSPSLPGSMSHQPPTHHSSQCTKAQEETEQVFPKVLLSWLSEFQKRTEEQSRTPEVSKTFRRTRKHFCPERHVVYLHHMYHLALLNMTSSRRLLEKNGQFAVAEREHSVRDLMEYLFLSHHEQPGNGSSEGGTEESTFPVLVNGNQQEQCHRGFSKGQAFKEMKNNSKEKLHRKTGATEILDDHKHSTDAFTPPQMITVPLTMEDVVLNNPVVEAKSSITYWTNYLNKNLFSKVGKVD